MNCTLSTETFCLSPSGPAAGNSGAGGDGEQVLPRFTHSAPQIPAVQQEGDGSGSTSAGSGGGNNRPDTKVGDSSIGRVLLWELNWWGCVLGFNLQKWVLLMAEIGVLGMVLKVIGNEGTINSLRNY